MLVLSLNGAAPFLFVDTIIPHCMSHKTDTFTLFPCFLSRLQQGQHRRAGAYAFHHIVLPAVTLCHQLHVDLSTDRRQAIAAPSRLPRIKKLFILHRITLLCASFGEPAPQKRPHKKTHPEVFFRMRQIS